MQRALTVSVHCNTHYVHTPSDIRKCSAPHAVNKVSVLFNNAYHTEESVLEFVDKFAVVHEQYYNLKRLEIWAPSITLSGKTLKSLLTVNSIYTELDLDLFAFHNPERDMWSDASVQYIRVFFHDGLLYPKSGTHILQGIEMCEDIQSIDIRNESPHNPTVKVAPQVRKKIKFTHGVRVR